MTHFYCQWKADLDLGGALWVTGTLSLCFGALAAVHHSTYSFSDSRGLLIPRRSPSALVLCPVV